MTFDERVRALAPLQLTPRQARFLATVALHSGYCVRRQYLDYAGVRYGKNVRDFLDGLVNRGLAARFTYRRDRGHIYHLHAKPIYRALAQTDNRNRRLASPALIARKLMLLDFVLSEPSVDWYATEEEKVLLFTQRLGIDAADLPSRRYDSGAGAALSTRRCFVHKLPIYVAGDPLAPHFVYLATDPTGGAFEQFLRNHGRLFAQLPSWTVVCLKPAHLADSGTHHAVFQRFVDGKSATLRPSEQHLVRYFQARRLVEAEQFARLSVDELYEYRAAHRRFSSASTEQSYASWLSAREQDAAAAPTPRGTTNGRLLIRTLPNPYQQFGSLPGVA